MHHSLHDYLHLIRFFKPGGTILVFLPHALGLTMAAHSQSLDTKSYVVWFLRFLIWSFVSRSLGCTINDLCDYEYDREVERTKNRPIASGRISVASAVVFTIAQMGLYLSLIWTNDQEQLFWRMLSFPLIIMYPVMKRVTPLPQAWLGIAMNWGFVMAWRAICKDLDVTVVVPMMGGLWTWTMYYDTIYACQDYKDDIRIGIGSSAIIMRNALYPFLWVCATTLVLLTEAALIISRHSPTFCIAAGAGMLTEMVLQLAKLNPYDAITCKKNLARNSYAGCVFLAGMVGNYIWHLNAFNG